MKRNIIIKGIVFFILMAACVFRFETDLMAAGAAGVVTISVEKFTIGQGYLVDPATVPITEGQSVADVLIPLLKNNGYEPEIATGAMYYLAGILKADNGNYKVPAIIGTMGGMTSSSGSGLTPPDGTEKNLVFPDLFELSYTQSAGWVYSVNGDFPTETMNDYRLKDGDVIRVQFTLYGYGGDVGQRYGDHPYLKLPDRNPLTKRLALMKTYKAICDGKGYAGAYSSAYAAAVNMDVSDADFYAAVNALPKEEQIISWVKEAEASAKKEAEKKKYMPARVTLKSVKPGKKQAVLTWKKSREATGYQVFLSAKKSSGFKKTATIRKAKTVTFKKKKLKSKKTYYFRVRAYRTVGKTTWYGPYSAVKKAKIK